MLTPLEGVLKRRKNKMLAADCHNLDTILNGGGIRPLRRLLFPRRLSLPTSKRKKILK